MSIKSFMRQDNLFSSKGLLLEAWIRNSVFLCAVKLRNSFDLGDVIVFSSLGFQKELSLGFCNIFDGGSKTTALDNKSKTWTACSVLVSLLNSSVK